MKTLERSTSWLLILILSFGLVACFGDDQNPTDPAEDTTAPAVVDGLVILEDQTTLNSIRLQQNKCSFNMLTHCLTPFFTS